MTEQGKDPTEELQDMARQSLQAWQQMWRQAVDQNPGAFAGAQTAEATPEAMQRVLDGLKGYLGWMENLSAASAATPGGMNWGDAFNQAFAGAAGNPFSEAFAEIPGMGSLDPLQFQQQISKLMLPMQQAMHGALSIPAFGLAREHQEQSQALTRAWLQYSQDSARYQALVARVGSEAANRVQEKLAEHEEPGRQINSMRGLYNLWVDAAEEAWADIAMSDEYREAYAAMTNAQMHVRQLVQQQVAEAGSQLGMPTREEVDSLGRRLQELRRDLADLRHAQRDADSAAGRKPSPAPKKRTAKKKAAPAKRAASGKKKAPTRKPASKKTARKSAAKRK